VENACVIRESFLAFRRSAQISERLAGGPGSGNSAQLNIDRPQCVTILGIQVSALCPDAAIAFIERWLSRREKTYVCVAGAHGLIESRRNPALRGILNEADMVTPDGMPLVFMAHRLGVKSVARVYGPDLMRKLTEVSAQKGYKQFYYGGGPGLAERLAGVLRERYPGLAVAGHYAPPFRALSEEEEEAEITLINAARPDIVWVGLSTPKQELWMASRRERLDAPVLIGVGAAFDFLAGTKLQAPGWMQRCSLEWLYRLASEPRRLWARYARIVPLFVMLAAAQLLAHELGSDSNLDPEL
jgi:N-acetylglucosaminyldiphosphoundecaprenol N-acetyl-beta-D-mannosaminyltransferase